MTKVFCQILLSIEGIGFPKSSSWEKLYFSIHMTLCWNYVAEWISTVVRYPFFPRPHLWIGTDCTNDVVRAFQTNFHFIYFFHRALVTPEGRTHVGTCQGRLLHRKGRWSNDVVCLFTPRGSTNIDISVRQLGLETRHFLTSTGEPELHTSWACCCWTVHSIPMYFSIVHVQDNVPKKGSTRATYSPIIGEKDQISFKHIWSMS